MINPPGCSRLVFLSFYVARRTGLPKSRSERLKSRSWIWKALVRSQLVTRPKLNVILITGQDWVGSPGTCRLDPIRSLPPTSTDFDFLPLDWKGCHSLRTSGSQPVSGHNIKWLKELRSFELKGLEQPQWAKELVSPMSWGCPWVNAVLEAFSFFLLGVSKTYRRHTSINQGGTLRQLSESSEKGL